MFSARSVTAVLLASCLSFPALAGTLHVPVQYPTIQAAIDAAGPGDVVLVADGTYTGAGNRDIDFRGKAITVRSASGPGACIIDCQGSESDPHRAFLFRSGEKTASVLAGFTVQSGYAPDDDEPGRGGAVLSRGSSPVIRDCTFQDNEAWVGGAMFVRGGDLNLIDCTFRDNTAGISGGAIHSQIDPNGHGVVTNCTFLRNQTLSPSEGGVGGMIGFFGEYTIHNCRFVENETARLTGGLTLTRTDGTVTDCTFIGNVAVVGGAMGVNYDGHATISNCLFTRNQNTGGERPAAALWVGDGFGTPSSAVVVNCTFSRNVAHQGGGALTVTQTSQASVANCIFWGDTPAGIALTETGTVTVSYSDVQGGWSGMGNINTDPLFADPNATNYRLRFGSKCIDAADNSAVPADGWYDLDSQRRFIDDPLTADTGIGPPSVVDMGCYEYQGKFKVGDVNCDDALNFADINPLVLILGDVNAWQARYPDCPRDNADVNYDRQINFGDINPFIQLMSGQ